MIIAALAAGLVLHKRRLLRRNRVPSEQEEVIGSTDESAPWRWFCATPSRVRHDALVGNRKPKIVFRPLILNAPWKSCCATTGKVRYKTIADNRKKIEFRLPILAAPWKRCCVTTSKVR